jgi:hypothetical protein
VKPPGSEGRSRIDAPAGMWWCAKCEQYKELGEFSRRAARDKPHYWCKPCHAAYARARLRKMTPEQKTILAAKKAEWIEQNPQLRKQQRLRPFGLTLAQYQERLAAQGGRCAICGGVNANGADLAIDHDHRCCPRKDGCCGECIRGLLCNSCNLGIGQLGDDQDRILAAAAYVGKWDNLRVIA